jgi:hypothetical protein
VLLACQGQLRFAPSGHVIGIDMDATLTLAKARGYDLGVLSELLPVPGLVWSRRCVTIEFGMMGLDQAPECPLTARLLPFRRTCVISRL